MEMLQKFKKSQKVKYGKVTLPFFAACLIDGLEVIPRKMLGQG